LFKNVGANWALNALQILVLLKLAPFVVETLGRDQNGVWVTIVSMTGVLSLLILGVPLASVRFVTEHVARRYLPRANAAISTCLGICLGLAGAALAIGAALYLFFELTYLGGPQGAALPPGAAHDARIAFGVVAIQVAAGFVLRLPYGIFDAHHDFVVRNLIMAGELVLRLGLTLGLLSWKASLPLLALVQVACMLFEFAVCIVVIRRRYPGIRFGLAHFDRALVRTIFGFSVFAMLLNVGNLLAFRSDAMVIGARLDPDQVTFFDMGNKFFDPMTGLLIAVGAVVMPMATKLHATGDREELQRVFLKWSKISLSIVLVIGTYLLVLGPEFLGWWVGPDFVEPSGRVLQVLMLSFLVFLPVRGVALPVLLGLGKPGLPAIALLAMGALNLGLSLALVGSHGILGVALGTAVPNVLFAVALLLLACRELGVPLASYLGYVGGRALIGAAAPLALLYAVKERLHPTSFVGLIGAGVGSVVVFAFVWVAFVYRSDPHLDLRPLRSRIARWFSGRGDGSGE
jgi:O-antigen/teichoic acid export membrane protein